MKILILLLLLSTQVKAQQPQIDPIILEMIREDVISKVDSLTESERLLKIEFEKALLEVHVAQLTMQLDELKTIITGLRKRVYKLEKKK